MNDSQKAAIYSEGPTLVIAGPGTGKTYTIIQRVLHLIQDKHVKPEEIMLVTYTVKASKELTTRLTNELSQRGIEVNLHGMYLGTFHHICRMILKEFREYTTLERNYLETDQFEQKYLVYGHLKEFDKIPDFEKVVSKGYTDKMGQFHPKSPWKRCDLICHYVGGLAEELLDPEVLRRQFGQALQGRGEVLGRMMMKYERISREENFIDYTRLQTETYRLLTEHPEIRKLLQQRIRYIMIDEYQDTDYIQEKLIQLLMGPERNVFVVGDDDQSIYRFRGATVGNILSFGERYGGIDKCHIYKLDTNYRSTQGIVDFCGAWMTKLYPHSQIWKKEDHGYYRYLKGKIKAHEEGLPQSVIKVTDGNYQTWLKKMVDLIQKLKKNGKITDYNQVALLWSSVKSYKAKDLQIMLERNQIPVYAPRAGHFFERKEVAWLLGCLLALFPCFSDHMEQYPELKETDEMVETYNFFQSMAEQMMEKPEHEPLKHWVERTRSWISYEKKMPDSLLGLVYSLLSFAPFSAWLDQAVTEEVPEVRNLSAITRLINRFGYFLKDNHGQGKETLEDVCLFFYRYLRLWFENKVDEYEDEERYAPSGKVSFLNIHQSKGLEYPVVIVASLEDNPWGNDDWIPSITAQVTGRHPYEPVDIWHELDFLRKYYTAFSRAETLLVLATHIEAKSHKPIPSLWFQRALSVLPEYDDPQIPYDKMEFRPVKAAHFKQRFSYTTQVALYEECPLKYKWSRIYRFASAQGMGLLFGQLVHETIEDIHRAVLRGEEKALTPAVLYGWMMANYTSLSKKENTWLSQSQLEEMFQQITAYVSFRKGHWGSIQEAELPLELVEEDYIMDGTIDLLQGTGDTVDIIDFKTGKKPKLDSPLLAKYRGQLEVYAYLVEKKVGKSIGKLQLYFTGSEDPLVTFDYTQEMVKERIAQFDETVHRIMNEDFAHKAEPTPDGQRKACQFCDWKHYCWRNT